MNDAALGMSPAFPTGVTFSPAPGTTGWVTPFGGRPAVLWNPHALSDAFFGVRTNRFGFTIAGASNLVIVVDACTNLIQSGWSPVGTNTLSGGFGNQTATQQRESWLS